jgi:hypothetical protein
MVAYLASKNEWKRTPTHPVLNMHVTGNNIIFLASTLLVYPYANILSDIYVIITTPFNISKRSWKPQNSSLRKSNCRTDRSLDFPNRYKFASNTCRMTAHFDVYVSWNFDVYVSWTAMVSIVSNTLMTYADIPLTAGLAFIVRLMRAYVLV